MLTFYLIGFNPRAHVGRDKFMTNVLIPKSVSIHAPTWGATNSQDKFNAELDVSIHAPTWGATRLSRPQSRMIAGFNPRAHVGRDLVMCFKASCFNCFNPRAHVGRDQRFIGIIQSHVLVSIHAPTWGATLCPR